MAAPKASLDILPPDEPAREIAPVWTLRRNSRVATCHFWTHPSGGEVRLTVDGEWLLAEALDGGLNLVDVTMEWQKQFQANGWS